MQKNKKIILGLAVILIVTTLSLSDSLVFAEFELGEIEDPADWFSSSTVVNFHEDFKTNLLFSFVNESLGLTITPYLSLQSQVNIPLNFTGYLSKKIKDDASTYGIKIGSSVGNISMGVNGSIDLTTDVTDDIHISIEEGSAVAFANFETIIGENVTIPINFSPIVVSVGVSGINYVTSLSLSLQPIAYLNGSISISSLINGQELSWITGDEVYFNEIPITDELGMYNISIEDISVNFDDVQLVTEGMNVIITLHSAIADVSEDFYIDLAVVDWTDETQEALDYFIIFLLDNVFNLENQEIMIAFDRASFPWFSIMPILALLAIFLVRKKRR